MVVRLAAAGCEILVCPGDTHGGRLISLLEQLGRRRLTNVLVEGGSQLLGNLFDARLIDEAHVFLAPKLIGGKQAPSPMAGTGIEWLAQAAAFGRVETRAVGDDVYVHAHDLLADPREDAASGCESRS